MKKKASPIARDNKTALSLLDVAGSCVVDIFYNHMYDRAIVAHEKTSAGLAECYRQANAEYVGESNNPRFYSVLLNSLHHYVRMSTIYHGITYTECVKLYTSLFIPQMYIASLTAEQSINIVSMILGNVVRVFADEIVQQHIVCIIDDHGDPLNVEILQDAVLQILIRERDESFKRFIDSQKTTGPTDKKTKVNKSQAVQQASLQKLTDAFKKSLNERMALKKQNTALAKKNKLLTKQIQELKAMLLTQISAHKKQSGIIGELKTQLEQRMASIASNLGDSSMRDDSSVASVASAVVSDSEDDIFSVRYIENDVDE